MKKREKQKPLLHFMHVHFTLHTLENMTTTIKQNKIRQILLYSSKNIKTICCARNVFYNKEHKTKVRFANAVKLMGNN